MKSNQNTLFSAIGAILAISFAFAISFTTGTAGTVQRTAGAQALPLPASDGVLLVELSRVLTEGAPRVFANDGNRMANLNSDIDEFKRRTAIDPRQFETLAVGARLSQPREGVSKVDHLVAIAKGKFDAPAFVAAHRASAKLTEQKHGAKTIYIVSVNDKLKLFGLLKLNVRDLAVTVLDPTTIAVGEPDAVRATIDAQAGRGAVDPALVAAARQTGALIGFAGNVPPTALRNLDTGLPGVDQSLESIRRVRGTVGLTATGFQLLTVLATSSAVEAQRLAKTVEAVRQVAPALLSVAGERGQLAQGAIQNLKVTTQGQEVHLNLELAQSELAAIMRVL